MTSTPVRRSYQNKPTLAEEPVVTSYAPCPPPPPPVSCQMKLVSEAEERAITKEVVLLIAELDPVTVRDGRIIAPPDVTEDLEARIRCVEGELLWALEKESGPRWGCSWIPARPPQPPWARRGRA